MALSAAMVWEVRTTGDDTNGGGFKFGATGTDYSQQNSAQVVFFDLVINGIDNTKVTSAGNPFTSSHVGNVINVLGGTGFTTGRYEILSVSGGAATLDRNVGTAGSTGGIANLGGALATLEELDGAMSVAGMRAWIKAGTYNPASNPTFTANSLPTNTTPYNRISGYTSTRGDGGRATIQFTSGTGRGIDITGSGWLMENLDIDVNNRGTSYGIQAGGDYCIFQNLKVRNWTSWGIYMPNNDATVFRCEFTGGSGSNAAIYSTMLGSRIIDNWVHDTTCHGVIASNAGASIQGNVISNCSGAAVDGIRFAYGCSIMRNTVYKSGRHGMNTAGSFRIGLVIQGNILSENGGYGIVGSGSAGISAEAMFDGNAFYSNTSGNRSNMDSTSVGNEGSGAHTNVRDVILSADPFVDKSTNDFRLNNTAGGGAVCRAAGFPSSWPGLSITGYPDMGAVQHQDSASGSKRRRAFAAGA